VRAFGDVVICFSGRGGERRGPDGRWTTIDREKTKERFRSGEARFLLCTDAAAEGLNFQFCGALVNVDMPWNPMRVEQRIGRIDRLGQSFPVVRIINLHYADTVEADVYAILRDRIGLFGKFVGKLQPILAWLPKLIEERAVTGRDGVGREGDQQALLREIDYQEAEGFDLDQMTGDAVADISTRILRMDWGSASAAHRFRLVGQDLTLDQVVGS
jgi:superfamily II DNA/RNA helicase